MPVPTVITTPTTERHLYWFLRHLIEEIPLPMLSKIILGARWSAARAGDDVNLCPNVYDKEAERFLKMFYPEDKE